MGDPQLRSDHPWFPGELSCSTFERLSATQAAIYERTTGRKVDSEEDRALASWYWRNLNYYHNFSPREYLWSNELSSATQDNQDVVYEYWSGLFGYGFALCGTTHAQYTSEMEHLLGHSRARVVGVQGHSSFEVFLKDPQYGTKGDWAMLDHDISAVVFDDPMNPKRLLNIDDIAYSRSGPGLSPRSEEERETLLDNTDAPEANRGWFKAGLYFPKENTDATGSDSFGSLSEVISLAPLSGYTAAPPAVTLRRNEALRRYLKPGLGGKTYAYWGPNMKIGDIPGPCRDRTWACEPERMFQATQDTVASSVARYGNAVYLYRPNFEDGSYRDAVVEEDAQSVTFGFHSPYPVAATPAEEQSDELWGVMEPGCTQGLVIRARAGSCTAQVSTDHGASWSDPMEVNAQGRTDLTDAAKGHHTYALRLNASTETLAQMGLAIRTICLANDRLIPHLKPDGTTITYATSGTAVFSAGPNVDQATPFITAGGFGEDLVEMTVPAPGGAPICQIHATAMVYSKNPPDEQIRYQIEYSSDGGDSWKPIVRDWRIEALGYQVDDRFAKSYCYGSIDLTDGPEEVVVRFSNDGGIEYLRTEVSLVYSTPGESPLKVTFNWSETEEADGPTETASHIFPTDPKGANATWQIPTGAKVETNWVEMTPAADLDGL